MKIVQISDFSLGSSIYGFYLCKEKKIKYTKDGKSYLDMVFTDSTGIVNAKLWEWVDDFCNRFQVGDPLAVKGNIIEFNGDFQLVVEQINKANRKQYEKYGFSTKLITKTISDSIDDLWEKLIIIINSLSHPYRKIVKSIFRNYEKKIKSIPKSDEYNQSHRGGFLKHLLTIIELSNKIISFYPDLKIDLVISGILLRDIGKVKSYSDDYYVSYTEAGKLIGHTVLGIEILQEHSRKINTFPEKTLLEIEHIILSSKFVKKPTNSHKFLFPEALFIYYLNFMNNDLERMLDSKNNSILI